MRLRSLIAVVLFLFTLTAAASAQVWPPTPDPGDQPYGNSGMPYGLLYKNGRAYKIEYVTTQNTAGEADGSSPCDFNLGASGFAVQASVNGFNVVPSGYLYGTLLYRVWLDKKMPWDVGPIVSTNAGAYSGTLRRVHLYLDYRYGSGSASGTSMPNPVYKFKVTALDPYNNNFGIVVEVAQGGFNYCYGYLQQLMPGYPHARSVIAQSNGRFSAAIALTSTGSPGASGANGSTTKMQGTSVFQGVTLTNGVGYFYTNTPLYINGTLSGMSADVMNVQSCFEIVPLRIFSGP